MTRVDKTLPEKKSNDFDAVLQRMLATPPQKHGKKQGRKTKNSKKPA